VARLALIRNFHYLASVPQGRGTVVTRFILAVCLVLSAVPAFAQAEREPDQPDQPGQWDRGVRRERPRRDWDDWPRRNRDGVHLRIFRDYTLEAGATANEPVVVIGGTATIDGHVAEDVVVIGGRLRLGPTAVVDGDVFTAGETTIDPAAQVKGKIDEAQFTVPGLDANWNGFHIPSGWWSFASLGAMTLRLGMVLTISLLLTLIAPGWIRAMAGQASSAASSGVLGAIVEVLFVPALLVVCVGLLISVVGIPLLAAIPFVLAGGALLWVAGFAAVAVALGARLRGSRGDASAAPLIDLVTGFLAITALTIVAHFIALAPGWLGPFGWMVRSAGLVIEYLAWTIGLGAALSTFFVNRSVVPPPVPRTA